MASITSPTKAILRRDDAPSPHSPDGPFARALKALEDMSLSNIALGPAMPDPDALMHAARKAGISPDQALAAYLAILDYE